MRYVTYLFFLAALALTACTETTIEIFEPVPSERQPTVTSTTTTDPDEPAANLVSTAGNIDVRHAYHITNPRVTRAGKYEHHIILTDAPIGSQGDVTAYTFTVLTEQAILNTDAVYAPFPYGGRASAGANRGALIKEFNLEESDGDRADGYLTNTVAFSPNPDGTMHLELSSDQNQYQSVQASIDVLLEPLPVPAETTLPTILGDNQFRHAGTTLTANYAYLKTRWSNRDVQSLHLYLAADASATDDRLSGNTDLFLFTFIIPSGAVDGTYTLTEPTGYLRSVFNGQRFGYHCTNMNFTTGVADDDDIAKRGSARLVISDGRVSAAWSYVSYQGKTMEGTYEGPYSVVR